MSGSGIRRSGREPTVSVIVTNHDYGGFLADCVRSVLAQTRRPDEIIVVDDGSRDDSLRQLETFGASVTVVAQANGGQAAAMNAGFARATGELLLFLDADDLLKPEAVETALLHQHPDVSFLMGGLEMIDTAGRSLGTFPASVAAVSGDHRRSLLARGVFFYPPTSGNVFRREAVAWIFPLPEARWRISPDAVLVSAAALHGPARAMPAIVGAYRVHQENGHYRQGAARLWANARGLADMADTLDLLAGAAGLPAADAAERRRLAARLAAAAATVRARRFATTGDRQTLRADLVRAAARAAGPGDGLGRRLGWGLVGLSGRTGWGAARVAGWLGDPRTLPRWLRPLMTPTAPERALDTPRRLARLRPGDELTVERDGSLRPVLAAGWIDETWGGAFLSAGPAAALAFRVEAGGRPIALDLTLGLPPGRHGVVVRLDGALAHQGTAEGRIALSLPVAASTEPAFDLRVDIGVEPAPGPGGLRRLVEPAGWFSLDRLAVADARPPPTVVPPPAVVRGRPDATPPLAGLLRPGPAFHATGSGDVAPAGPFARLLVDRAGMPADADLVLAAGAADFHGWLRLSLDGRPAFEGQLVGGSVLRLPMPAAAADPPAPATLDLHVLDAGPGEPPAFASLGVARRPAAAARRVRLNLGETLSLSPEDGRPVDAGPDFTATDQGLTTTGFEAVLPLLLPEEPGERTLRIDLEPVLPVPDRRVVAGLSVDGEMRLSVEVGWGASVSLPVGTGPVALGLHAVALGADGGEPAVAPLRLTRIALSGTVAARPTASEPGSGSGSEPAGRWPVPPLVAAAERMTRAAADLARSTDGAALARLAAARADLAEGIAGASGKTLRAVAATDGWLAAVTRTFPLARLAPLGEPERAHLFAARALFREGGEADRLRAVLLALVLDTPEALGGVGLDEVPAPLAHRTGEMAAFLTREPAFVADEAAAEAAVAAATRLYRDAAAVFAVDEPDDLRFRLAEAVLDSQRNLGVLFGGGPLADLSDALADAVERRLLRRGHALFRPPRGPRTRARLKVGILVFGFTATPEGRLASGLAEALRRGPFEPVVVTLAATGAPWSGAFERPPLVDVGGLGTADAVDAIRDLDLDVAVLGCFLSEANRAAEIFAHRLAPLQVDLAAVSPMTAAFRSVDAVLSSPMTEPDAAAGTGHARPLALAADPFQCFDPAGWTDPVDREEARRRFGLRAEAVVLVSGAMWGKINDALIGAWTDILAAVPAAVLVLYPFAPNWKRPHTAARMRARFAEALRAKGLAADRITVLDPLDAEGVRACLAAADLYLDSFPYAGATTVAEALAAGRPVATLAGATQRGLQGAAWARKAGLDELVAADPADYARRAAAVAGSAERRAALEAGLAARAADGLPFADPAALNAALEPVLLRLAAERGVTLRSRAEAEADRGDGAVRFHVFHHLPKAAGTTCNAVFRSWFTLVRDYRPGWDDAETPPPQDLSALTPEHMLAGHFDTDILGLERRYPEILTDRRCRMITFFRDPVETALSAHAFEDERRRHEPGYTRLSVDAFLAECGSVTLRHLRCAPEDWRAALDRYFFAGTVERLPECLAWLARRLGKPVPDIPRLNATPRAAEPSAAAVADFVARNAIDYEIYAEVNRRLDVLFTASADAAAQAGRAAHSGSASPGP